MNLTSLNVKSRGPKVKSSILCFFTSIFLCGLCGCTLFGDFVGLVTPEGPPSDKQVAAGYYQTKLKKSSAADVLTVLHNPEYELLSQSKSVVASVGQKKNGKKSWLNMVAFSEDEPTVMRKYLLIADERPKIMFTEPWEGLSFDCEIVLESKILDEPYSNENARRIEILRQVREDIQEDIEQVESDNKTITVFGMLINQALETVLVKLDSSPVLATKLDKQVGVNFNHLSFSKGEIQMVIVNDVVRVKVRLGSFIKKSIGDKKYICTRCGYIYDPFLGEPEQGVVPGTSFEDLPGDWTCPGCGADKSKKHWTNRPKPLRIRPHLKDKRVGL